MRLRPEGCVLCQELGHLQLPPWVYRGDMEAQPVPILTGPPRAPGAGRLHTGCPLPCPEETPPCREETPPSRELAVGRGGQALPGTPTAAVPRAGAGGGSQRWAVRPAPALLVGTTRPRTGLPLLDVPSSPFIHPVPSVALTSCGP